MKETDTRMYPCTIVPTRYGGAYERGKWAAFPLRPDELEYLDWDAGDAHAAAWWRANQKRVGVGASPEEAYKALEQVPAGARLELDPDTNRRRWKRTPPVKYSRAEERVPARVSFVTLATRDFGRMAAFYRQFGWPESKDGNEEFVAFQTGGAILGLFAARYYASLGDAPAPGSFKGFELAMNLEDAARVDAVHDAVQTFEGIRILGTPKDLSIGGRSFGFLDPEGNAWEVIWKSGTSFDVRGGLIFP